MAIVSLVAAVPLYAVALPLSDFWFYFGPSARFAELLVGAALALWFQSGGTPRGPGRYATARRCWPSARITAITLFATGGAQPALPLRRGAGHGARDGGAHLRRLRQPGGPVHRLLGHPWLAGIGRCSYSLYLWHVVPMLLLEKSDLALPKPVLGLMAVLATIALTALSYQLLERPFLRPRSDVLRPRQVDRAAATSGADAA